MVGHNRRGFMLSLGAAFPLVSSMLPTDAIAQNYPERPIRLVNPWAPGGSADIVARLIAQKMSEELRQPIIIDNRPGAAGTVGSDLVAKSAPDGYTLILSTVASHAIAVSLYPKLPYSALADFEHIGMIDTLPNALLVGASFPARNLSELIALAKAKPSALSFGSAGNGSSPHLAGEMFKAQAGIDALHVPFKGGAPALQALLGGEISFMFESISTINAHVKSGKLRVLGTTGAKRSPMLPNVPTLHELGLTNFVAESWHGISAPAGTPGTIVARLNAALRSAVETPSIHARLIELGVTPGSLSPAQFRDFIKSEIDKWKTVVEISGAKVE